MFTYHGSYSLVFILNLNNRKDKIKKHIFLFGKFFYFTLKGKFLFVLMPKLYEYFDLSYCTILMSMKPIHGHGKYQGWESKAELIIEDDELVDIRISKVKEKRPLEPNQLRTFKLVVEHYAEEIMKKWINYFVYHKHIESEKISRRIK